MSKILKWAKLESIMIALFQVKGKLRPNFIRFKRNHISIFENSY